MERGNDEERTKTMIVMVDCRHQTTLVSSLHTIDIETTAADCKIALYQCHASGSRRALKFEGGITYQAVDTENQIFS